MTRWLTPCRVGTGATGLLQAQENPKAMHKNEDGARPERVGVNADAKKPQNRGVEEQESVGVAETWYGGTCPQGYC